MIGRPVAAGLGAVVLLGAIFSQRSPDPRIADPANVAAVQAATLGDRDAAARALGALGAALQAALDEGRQGAALTVQTAGQPGPHLTRAGEQIGAAEPMAAAAQAALARLAGDLDIRGTGTVPSLALEAGALSSIGAQLAAGAAAADAFWAMHRSTQATLDAVGAALARLDAKDPVNALRAMDQADASLAKVRAWRGTIDTLPIWVATTAKLASAVRALAEAVRDHDLAAADAAAAEYRAAADEAHRADLALAIAVAEGGGSVSSAPLAAAADALRAVDDARAEVNGVEVSASILA
jgi:hypothetical protein